MKKFISVLCAAVLLTGCAAKKEAEVSEPEKAPVETVSEQEDAEEIQEAEGSRGEKEILQEVLGVEAEGVNYLSVEGTRVPEASVLAMIGKDSTSGFWKQVKAGAEQAVADLNESLGYTGDEKVKLLYDAPEKEDISEQIDIIDQMLDKNPDALCIGFVDINSGKTQLELAKANGIPVLAVDSGIENSLILSTIKTDNYQAGREAAEKLCDAMEDNGKVALLVHSSLTESGIEREKGFTEEIQANHPEVEIVNVAYRQQDERNVDEIVAAVLQEHPDLKAYFGTNDVVTRELVEALSLQGTEEHRVLAAGFDASAKLIQAVKEGRMTGVMAQNPWGMGYAAAVSAFRTMAGMDTASVIDTGYYWISSENMEEEIVSLLTYK